jgi:hypothetical protein
MNISQILNKQMKKSGGCARLVKVPTDKRPTFEALKRLEREISAQVQSNENMRGRSIYNAFKNSK